MNWVGGGFITIILYALGQQSEEQDNSLLTEDNFDILTEAGDNILTE
jgi:hypothetical protein